MIDIFGRSTIVAQFEQRLAADDGRPFTYNTYSGIRGLENSRHPDAQRALQELRDTETAIRANPETLANVPSASGREANHGLRGALVVAATRPLSPVSIPRDAKATYEV